MSVVALAIQHRINWRAKHIQHKTNTRMKLGFQSWGWGVETQTESVKIEVFSFQANFVLKLHFSCTPTYFSSSQCLVHYGLNFVWVG